MMPQPKPKPAQPFPLRVAGIDVGSNGIRYLAVEFSSLTRFRILDSKRAPLRLGQDAFTLGRLRPKTLALTIAVLKTFVKRNRKLGIRHCRAIATSAVRESKNRDVLVAMARRRLGLELEIVTGSEEARLVLAAIGQRLRLGRRQWLVINLGGGSVEVFIAAGRRLLRNESHMLGAVRLWEEFKAAARNAAQMPSLLEHYLSTFRLPGRFSAARLAGCIATGGNIEDLAKLAQARPAFQGFPVLSLVELENLIRTLAAVTPRTRQRRYHLKPNRADVILPAAVVYGHILRQTGLRSLIVPGTGTKEGLVLDLAGQVANAAVHARLQAERIRAAAVALGRQYHFDEAHGLQVSRLALELFDQLQALHRLGGRERMLLLAAGVLHDIGAYISFKKHHKHSGYLISQSEMPELTPQEMLVVAAVARYHRKNTPRAEHMEYARLTTADRRRVDKLSAILRLADALDRDHSQTVRHVRVQLRKTSLRLQLEGSGQRDWEEWALRKKAQWFQKVFRRQVHISDSGRERTSRP